MTKRLGFYKKMTNIWNKDNVNEVKMAVANRNEKVVSIMLSDTYLTEEQIRDLHIYFAYTGWKETYIVCKDYMTHIFLKS